MKYIKASICSIAAFSVLPYIQSAENLDPLFAEIKKTKRARTYNQLPDDEKINAINEGFAAIEKGIFNGSSLPQSLKAFYREVGNYRFGLEILSPIRGIDSPLYDGITKGQKKEIPLDWIVFGQLTESEYFCIHRISSQIARFLVAPEPGAKPYTQADTYDDMASWIKKQLLEIK